MVQVELIGRSELNGNKKKLCIALHMCLIDKAVHWGV